MKHDDVDRHEAGFTLVETLAAMGLLTIGLLALAQVLVLGMASMSFSAPDMIAREKAREAVESVHTARDTRTITWPQIRNVSQGGVFLDGERPLRVPGPDGLVNTADDPDQVEAILAPGPDGVIGTADDVRTPLTNFWRTIVIADIAGEPSLRQLRVTIRYQVGAATRTYVLTTFVSSYA